jgi:hypothetical protein
MQADLESEDLLGLLVSEGGNCEKLVYSSYGRRCGVRTQIADYDLFLACSLSAMHPLQDYDAFEVRWRQLESLSMNRNHWVF